MVRVDMNEENDDIDDGGVSATSSNVLTITFVATHRIRATLLLYAEHWGRHPPRLFQTPPPAPVASGP